MYYGVIYILVQGIKGIEYKYMFCIRNFYTVRTGDLEGIRGMLYLCTMWGILRVFEVRCDHE